MNPVVRYHGLERRRVVGLMSGTSADGIDVAVVDIGPGTAVKLASFRMVRLPDAIRPRLFDMFAGRGELRDAPRMEVLMGELFADAAKPFLDGVDLIASHGQTVYHQPVAADLAGYPIRCTWQLGDGCVIAARTGCPVVSDFRVADLALGGQGAPLVPYADARLFTHADRYRVALNIGGIANLTWLPSSNNGHRVRAFDTGPGNALMDAVLSIRTAGAEQFDADGRRAAAGHVQEAVLTEMLAHPYFQQRGARSTGREDFGQPFVEDLLQRWGTLSTEDLLATLAALSAETISRGLRELPRVDEVYVAGGGAHNRTLLAMLSDRVPGLPIRPLHDLGVDVDAREAVAFALMGDATMRGEPSNVPTATGASGPAILGKISLPPPLVNP